jgi:hypothetical protein
MRHAVDLSKDKSWFVWVRRGHATAGAETELGHELRLAKSCRVHRVSPSLGD